MISMALNTLAPRRCGINFKSVISEHMLQIKCMGTSEENCSQVNATEYLWWEVKCGSDNAFLADGIKPLA